MGDKEFNLDSYGMLFQEFMMRHARMNEDKKWCDQFKANLKELSRGAQSYKLGGRMVAQLVAGQLNKTDLEKEQPDLVKKYTRIVAKEQFDVAAFMNNEPGLFEQYRAQRFVLVTGEPAFEGLK